MKISIIHATKNRPVQAARTCKKWLDFAITRDIEYILSIDFADVSEYNLVSTHNIIRNHNNSAIEAFNEGAKQATGDLLIAISDDSDCNFGWDRMLIDNLRGIKPNFCVKTIDGIQPTLITMPIMDRAFYESLGYIYNPAYGHMFVDQELTAIAIMTGRYVKLQLPFLHLHYTVGGTPKDAINEKNDATWAQGEALFNQRLKTNFGIENPVIPYSEIIWK